jgi:hypothetical protein
MSDGAIGGYLYVAPALLQAGPAWTIQGGINFALM